MEKKSFYRVAILFFTYNRLDYTKLALKALLENTYYPFELHIVDNASTDGTVEFLAELEMLFPETIRSIVYNKQNLGLPGPTNEFWQRVNADFYGKVDNDTVVPKGWLEKLVDAHLKIPELAVVSAYHFPIDEVDNQVINQKIIEKNGVKLLLDTHVGGCAYLIKNDVIKNNGFMHVDPDKKIHGWTGYQNKLNNRGYLIGYYYPLIALDYLDDPRNEKCLLSTQYMDYAKEIWKERGIDLKDVEQIKTWLIKDNERIAGKKKQELKKKLVISSEYLQKTDPNTIIYQVIVNNRTNNSIDNNVIFVENIDDYNFQDFDFKFDEIHIVTVLEKTIGYNELLQKCRDLLNHDGLLNAVVYNLQNMNVVEELVDGCWNYRNNSVLDKQNYYYFTKNQIIKVLNDNGFLLLDIQKEYDRSIVLKIDKQTNELHCSKIGTGIKDQEKTDDFLVDKFILKLKKGELKELINHKVGNEKYYIHKRPDVAALVPKSAIKILDVGCASGGLIQTLKEQNPGRVITGIELNPEAAKIAKQFADEILVANLENSNFNFEKRSFDCIIFADIIEHLKHSEDILLKFKEYLKDDGTIVISLPNIRNYEIIHDLINGKWEYLDAGILDRTHIRFFTRDRIEQLLKSLDFSITQIERVFTPTESKMIKEWTNAGKPNYFGYKELSFNNFSKDDVYDLFTEQFLIKTEKKMQSVNQSATIVSIIIPVYNQIAYTKACIESIYKYTIMSFELIIVDNGSTDNTMLEINTLNRANLKIIRNEYNRGFGTACNQGIKVATGKYVLILNNDTIVTQDWLKDLIDSAETNDKIGIVAPVSNYVGDCNQLIYPVTYRNFDELQKFALNLKLKEKRNQIIVQRVIFLCVLLKRTMLDEIGIFDEKFGIGNYEDDDLCYRAGLNGWKICVRKDVFVHHFGSRTFYSNEKELDHNKRMVQNGNYFFQKWQLNENAYNKSINRPDRKLLIETTLEDFEEKIKKGDSDICINIINPLVSVIIPTYNRKDRLSFAIRSVLNQTYQNFEILVINDCGDDVFEVIESLNDQRIKYFVQPENKGPAAARNVGLHHATGDYIAYLDDDDIYYPNHLSILCEAALKNTEINVFYSDAMERMMKQNGTERVTISEVVRYSIDFNQETLLTKNITPTLCIFHKRCIIDKSGVFDESLKTHEDWDLWLKFSKLGRFLHIKKTTCEYSRVEGGDSLTINHLNKFYESLHLIYNRYPVSDEKIQAGRIHEMQKLINLMQKTAASSKPVMVSDSAGGKSIKYCIELIKNNEFVKAQTELEALLLNDPLNNNVLFLLYTAAIAQKNNELFLRTYSKLLQLEEQNNSTFADFELYLKNIVPQKKMFRESANAHKWLDGLTGIEIGSAAHNSFGLNSRNVALRIDSYGYSFLKDYGLVSRIDLEAEMSDIPLESESEDFILSSHAIEHSANFIKTVLEWYRICKVGGYIYVITPKKNACDSHRTLSDWQKIYNDYLNDTKAEKDYHYNVFTIELMKDFFYRIFGDRVELVDFLESDDKVGNGFTVVYRKTASLKSAFPWIIRNGAAEHDLLFAPQLLPKGYHKEQSGKCPAEYSQRIKVAVFPNDLKKDGCSHYRILSPLGALVGKVEVLWVEDFINSGHKYAKEYADKADLIVIQRFFPNPDTQKFIDYLFSLNKPIVYEVDDLLTEVPSTNPSHGWSNIRKPFMLETAKRASAVTVTTLRLKNYFSNINPNTVVLPNLLNNGLWQNPVPHHESVVVIAYAGTKTHAADLRIIEQALFMVSEKYKGRVGFIFMGCKTDALERLTNFNFIPPESDYNTYAQTLQTLPVDLMLVPLAESEFNNCKSNIKWLEYSACEIPCIFSNLEPYNSCVKDHQTGLLVKNDTLSWLEAICEMVDNAELRKQIARAARKEVLEKYTVNSGAHLWYEFYMLLILSNNEKFTSVTARREMATVVSFSLAQDIPSSQYLRQIAPLALLEKSHQLELVNGWSLVSKKEGKPFFDYTKLPSDAIIFLQRDFTSLEFVLEAPLKVIYEIDDNLMGLSPEHPDYQAYLPLINLLKKYLPSFDQIITSTESLKQELVKYNKNVTVIPNYIPFVPPYRPKEKLAKIKILISGTKSHLADMMFLIPVIKKVAIKYVDLADFVIWGFFPDELRNIPNVHFMDVFVKDYRDYLNALGSLNADIGLIPLADTNFNGYKSDVKWKEYGACRMAVVASDVLAYQSIENGRDGILLPNQPEIWMASLEELIINSSSRENLANNAYQSVIERYLLGNNIDRWNHLLRKKIISEVKADETADCLVSIIIPVYNHFKLTKQCLDNLLALPCAIGYELIIVDNNSLDETQSYFKQNTLSIVRYYRNNSNLGFAKACNQGAAVANGQFLVFLNNDTIPLAGWLDNLHQAYVLNSQLGIAGCKLLYPDDTVQHCGVSMRYDNKFFRHHYKYLPKNHPLVNKSKSCDAVTAACMMISKTIFEQCDGFDEHYLNGCEDIDLCNKVRQAGYQITYCAEAVLYHLESQTQREKPQDVENFKYYLSRWGKNSIKNEIEVYTADGFWQMNGDAFIPAGGSVYASEFINKYREIESRQHASPNIYAELLGRIYPVEIWSRAKQIVEASSAVVQSVSTVNFPKILFVCHDFPPYKYAGAQLYAYYLALALTKNGYQVDIFYPVAQSLKINEAEKELYSVSCKEFIGLRVYEITIPDQNENLYQAFYNPRIEQAFKELLLKENYQIVHYHLLHRLSASLPLVSQELKVKSVATLHDYWLLCIRGHMIDNKFLECSGPATYEKCSLCQFGEIKPEYSEYFQTRLKLTKAAYAAIDYKISPSEFLAAVHRDYGFVKPQVLPLGWLTYQEQRRVVNPAKIVFGYLGQVVSRKGLDILLQAVKLLELNNWELKIYGEVYEPWYFEKIQPVIENHPNISYFGGYDNADMTTIFNEIDIFVMPSRRENYPLTLIEALSAKIPAVASDVGGVREMMTDGREGFVFKNGDVMQLKTILEYLLQHPEMIPQMKNSIGRLKTIEDNSLEMIERYSELLKSKKVVFACIRELHLPVLLPVCEQLKKLRPDLQIGFMAPAFRESKDGIPQEGLSAASLELLKLKKIDFWGWNNRREKFDCVVCADVCYWYVDGWGPIVNVGHGTISKGVYYTSENIARRENFADVLCVPGEWYRNCYGGQVVTNIAVTGFAKMDELSKTDLTQLREGKFAQAGFLDGRTTILYAPTFNLELTSMIILAESWQKLSNQYQVFIKLHGACEEDLKKYYRRLCELLPNRLFFVEDADIADYMLISDLMISDVSSVALEYLVLNKPVILVDNPDMTKYVKYNPQNVEFLFRNCAYCVKSELEMFTALADLNRADPLKERRMTAKKELFGLLDGKNSLRIANQIHKLLNEKPKLTGRVERFSVYIPSGANLSAVKENLLRAKVVPIVYVEKYKTELQQWEQLVVRQNELPGSELIILTGENILPYEWDNLLSLILLWQSDYDLLAPMFDQNCTNPQQKYGNYRSLSHDISQPPYNQGYQGLTKYQENFFDVAMVDQLKLDGLVINLKVNKIDTVGELLNNQSLKKGVLTGVFAYKATR